MEGNIILIKPFTPNNGAHPNQKLISTSFPKNPKPINFKSNKIVSHLKIQKHIKHLNLTSSNPNSPFLSRKLNQEESNNLTSPNLNFDEKIEKLNALPKNDEFDQKKEKTSSSEDSLEFDYLGINEDEDNFNILHSFGEEGQNELDFRNIDPLLQNDEDPNIRIEEIEKVFLKKKKKRVNDKESSLFFKNFDIDY